MANKYDNLDMYKSSFDALDEFGNNEFTGVDFETLRTRKQSDIDGRWPFDYQTVISLTTLRKHGFVKVSRREYLKSEEYFYEGEKIPRDVFKKMPKKLRDMCEVTSKKNRWFRNWYTVDWDKVYSYEKNISEYTKAVQVVVEKAHKRTAAGVVPNNAREARESINATMQLIKDDLRYIDGCYPW